MKVERNLTTNQVIGIAKDIRGNMSRKAIEAKLQPFLTEQNSMLKDYFGLDTSVNGLPLVYCHDLTSLISKICQIRNCDASFIKIGFDSGRKQLKLTMNIVDQGEQGGAEKRAEKKAILQSML